MISEYLHAGLVDIYLSIYLSVQLKTRTQHVQINVIKLKMYLSKYPADFRLEDSPILGSFFAFSASVPGRSFTRFTQFLPKL